MHSGSCYTVLLPDVHIMSQIALSNPRQMIALLIKHHIIQSSLQSQCYIAEIEIYHVESELHLLLIESNLMPQHLLQYREDLSLVHAFLLQRRLSFWFVLNSASFQFT